MSRPVLAPLLLPGNPSGVLEAVPKQYADGFLAGKVISAPGAGQDGLFLKWDNAVGTWIYSAATGGSGSPGGSTGQVQFNNAGAFAGSANLTYASGTGLTLLSDPFISKGTGTAPTLSSPKFLAFDTIAGYMQVVIQNQSKHTSASSDIICMTDTGSDSAEYIDFGINNSQYSGTWGAAKDGYLYVDGGTSGVGDLVIGTQQPNTYVDVNVGGGTNRCVRFAPDKSIILTAISDEPAVPSAGYLTVYAKSIAGRLMPKWVGPSGVDTPAQAALFQNRVILWTPGSGTAMLASGMTPTTAATLSHPTITTGSIGTVMNRVQFATSTTAGNASGARGAAACLIGNALNRGGFFFACRFNQGSLHTTGVQKMVGLSSSTAALAGEPSSSMADFIGMCLDSTDSVWQFSRRTGTGAATKINLGVTAAANQVFELTMFAKPGVSELFVRILQIANDGTATTLLDTSYTTTIPAATTLLAPHFQVRNGALTAAHNMALGRLYLESDF